MSDQEEKKTKETDETKDTTPEATPEDKKAVAETLIDEGLIEEEPETKQPDEIVLEVTVKEKIRPEIKTALVILALILLCIVYTYIIAFSENVLTGNVYANTIFFTALTGAVCAIFGTLVLTHGKKRASIELLISLFLIFTIPAIAFIIPLSRYHNLNQIERDKKIVEIFQISREKDKIMIILPDEYQQEHSYLQKVFSLEWETKGLEFHRDQKWGETAIPCRRGSKYWYEAELPLELKDNKITFLFDHAWQDYETTKKVSFPDPNNPNSL